MKQINSADARKSGAGMFIGGIIWIILMFFILNPFIYTSNINKWLGGWVGVIWDIVFISFMLGGLYFMIIGLLAMVTEKAYEPMKDIQA